MIAYKKCFKIAVTEVNALTKETMMFTEIIYLEIREGNLSKFIPGAI